MFLLSPLFLLVSHLSYAQYDLFGTTGVGVVDQRLIRDRPWCKNDCYKEDMTWNCSNIIIPSNVGIQQVRHIVEKSEISGTNFDQNVVLLRNYANCKLSAQKLEEEFDLRIYRYGKPTANIPLRLDPSIFNGDPVMDPFLAIVPRGLCDRYAIPVVELPTQFASPIMSTPMDAYSLRWNLDPIDHFGNICRGNESCKWMITDECDLINNTARCLFVATKNSYEEASDDGDGIQLSGFRYFPASSKLTDQEWTDELDGHWDARTWSDSPVYYDTMFMDGTSLCIDLEISYAPDMQFNTFIYTGGVVALVVFIICGCLSLGNLKRNSYKKIPGQEGLGAQLKRHGADLFQARDGVWDSDGTSTNAACNQPRALRQRLLQRRDELSGSNTWTTSPLTSIKRHKDE